MMINRVTLLGHKDHGKSTLIGSLLIATGSVTEERIKEAKRISTNLGRQFEPGFILDSFSEEREGGLTIDTTRAQIKYKDSAFEFIDVPGHEELIKNMMSGASHADFALLLVSAKEDEGIRDQTKRHVFLARMMGIRRIIVAVNKMDTVEYSQRRFNDIVKGISAFFERAGFDARDFRFVPISAYNSENLSGKSKKMPWYDGVPLLEALREASKEKAIGSDVGLRLVVQGFVEGHEGMLAGRVVSGSMKNGERVLLLPDDEEHMVKELFVKGKKSKAAKAGENVAFRLDELRGFDYRGSVVCGVDDDADATQNAKTLIFVTRELGKNASIRINGVDVPCAVRIDGVVDTTTGEVTRKSLEPLNAANATLTFKKPVPMEPFDKLMDLGRFVLYEDGKFSGIGIVRSL